MTRDRGNATVEFVAVVPLVFLVGLAVVQLALLAHAQSVLGAAASEAARVAAVSAQPERAARQTAEDVVGSGLGQIEVTGFQLTRTAVSGLDVVSVEIRARPDMAMLPDIVEITGTGSALVEAAW